MPPPEQGQFMKERGRLVRVFRLDGFARTRRPRSILKPHELALFVAEAGFRFLTGRGSISRVASLLKVALELPTVLTDQ